MYIGTWAVILMWILPEEIVWPGNRLTYYTTRSCSSLLTFNGGFNIFVLNSTVLAEYMFLAKLYKRLNKQDETFKNAKCPLSGTAPQQRGFGTSNWWRAFKMCVANSGCFKNLYFNCAKKYSLRTKLRGDALWLSRSLRIDRF